jgi:hypothetical protein
MPKTNLQHQIFVDALPSKVWKVLTGCDYTKQYFPEANIQSQWTEGSAILSKKLKRITKEKFCNRLQEYC